ncbi:MAG: hypothetical protein M3458_09795 [Acidobacteriota bacterium]|nr:hypothetical protein [Acidobacteriota bacterium]
MKSNVGGLLTRTLMLVLGLFLMLPTAAVAAAQRQDGYWGRGNNQRRESRQERRQERREERREDRQERRGERRGRDWNRYDNYGGSFQLRQTALNAGYNNGIDEGRKDRRNGDRFDFRDEGDYQKATEDYSSRLGDRELYRRYFREGFGTGYEDGYRGY